MSGGWALQQALYGALTGDAGVAALVSTRIFDDVPRDAALPYIVIGEDEESDWSTVTESGSEHSLTLHVWSRAAGYKEIKQICDAVRGALDGAAPPVSGFYLIDLRFENTRTARQNDGRTYHAIMRFRAVLEPQE
jgi:hypothetical protein